MLIAVVGGNTDGQCDCESSAEEAAGGQLPFAGDQEHERAHAPHFPRGQALRRHHLLRYTTHIPHDGTRHTHATPPTSTHADECESLFESRNQSKSVDLTSLLTEI